MKDIKELAKEILENDVFFGAIRTFPDVNIEEMSVADEDGDSVPLVEFLERLQEELKE